jgi:hypothetical protein
LSSKRGTISTAKPCGAGGGEKIRRSGAVGAEMEIEADGDAGDRQLVEQDALDEIIGAQRRQCGVEPEHDRAVEAGRLQQAQLVALVGQAEQRLVRPEKTARVRLEGEGGGGVAQQGGASLRGRNDGPVAAMHTVKIADGDHRAAQRVRTASPARHGKAGAAVGVCAMILI